MKIKTFLLLLLSVSVVVGCTKMPAGPTESEPVAGLKLMTQDKFGNIISIDQADEPIVIAGSIQTADSNRYKGYWPLDPNGYMIVTLVSNFVSLKYTGQSGELVNPVYVNFGAANTRLTQYQIDKTGSYLVFTVARDRSISQTNNQPPFELTFFHDQDEVSDLWQGSLNNWSESNRTAWFPALVGDYYIVTKEAEDQNYPALDTLSSATVKNYGANDSLGSYRIPWYTVNNQGTGDQRDDRLTPTFHLNANGTISAPAGALAPEQIRIWLGG